MGEKLLALTPKRRRFVEEYRVDWNATQAAIRAGYSRKTAGSQAHDLLKKPEIQEALAEVMQEDSLRTQITVDQIIGEAAKIAFLNMFDYIRIGENGEPFVDLSALTRAQAAGLLSFKHKEYKDGRGEEARDVCEVEIKLNPGKFNALVKLGERLGAWKPAADAGDEGINYAQIIADNKLHREKMAEIAERYGAAVAPFKKIEKAKETR
jgi:phage terminase small subunit